MRALDKGRIVKLKDSHNQLPGGTVCRVLDAYPSSDSFATVAVQVAPGSKCVDGAPFWGHAADGLVRTRGYYIPRYKLAPQRDLVKTAREFTQRYSV